MVSVLLFDALGSALAPTVHAMVVACFVLGLAVGAATVPLFLAEMAPAYRGGRMVTINELTIVTGQLLTFVKRDHRRPLWWGPRWRVMLGVAAVPAVLLFVGMLLLPDSQAVVRAEGPARGGARVLALTRAPVEAEHEFQAVAEHPRRDAEES